MLPYTNGDRFTGLCFATKQANDEARKLHDRKQSKVPENQRVAFVAKTPEEHLDGVIASMHDSFYASFRQALREKGIENWNAANPQLQSEILTTLGVDPATLIS